MNLIVRIATLLFFFSLPMFIPDVARADFQKIKVAVLDFEQKGKFETEDIGKMIAEWLTTHLVETGRFDIVERRLLTKIIEEQKIGASGVVDPNSASQLGKVLGVKTVVTGSVSNYGGIIDINARLINVETASIRAAESVSTESPRELRSLVERISERIIQTFPLEGYIIERIGNRVILDLGLRNGVRVGMKFNVYIEGKTIKHPKTGEILDVEKIDRGIVEVTEVKEKTSTAVILKEAFQNCIEASKCLVRGLPKDEEERVEREKKIAEEAARERAVAEKRERDRIEAEIQAERERQEAARLAEQNRIEAQKRAERERIEAGRRAERERIEAERRAERERIEAERERQEAEERAAREREEAKKKRSFTPLPSF